MHINLKEKSSFLKNYLFFENFKYQNCKKRFITPIIQKVDKKNLSLQKVYIFYRTFKIIKYKKNIEILSNEKIIKQKQTFDFIKAKKNISNRLKNSIFYKIFILNYALNKKNLLSNYVAFQGWKYSLFPRSISLFIDFVKIVDLVGNCKVQISVLGYLLGLVFKTLHKRKHGKFFQFIKELIVYFLKFKKIKGAQLEIRGRLKGKPRASNLQIKDGTLDLNSCVNKLEYTQINVYTLYGAYGFKLWINYK